LFFNNAVDTGDAVTRVNDLLTLRKHRTLLKLEEDVLGEGTYPAPQDAYVRFGRPVGVARFLEKRGEGLHHICLRVTDIEAAVERLRAAGARMLSDEPRVNEHGTRYIFIHPRAAHGVLLELYEVAE
jgi:catechol 2,3-dioxygenase-like lactoylglutathione lyase family enzyme